MAVTTYTSPKTWAYKESLSSADMNTYVRDNVAALKEHLPIASFMYLAYSETPDGPFLACDGSAVSRTTYAALYALIGTTWGVGDGSTTFNLPDARGRVAVGSGTGSGLTARAVGDYFGEETHLLTTAEMPSHTHTYSVQAISNNGGGGTTELRLGGTQTTGSAGGDTAHNNLQPSYVVKTFIRYA